MRKFIFGLLILVAVVIVGLQITHSYAYLAPDSFTYFTMARQVFDAGRLFSFSGVDYTTGIHPGFYFLLIPFYPLVGVNLPAVSLFLGAVLLLGSIILLYRSLGLLVAGVVGVGALTPYGLTLFNNGMESSLSIFILSWLIFVLVKNKAFQRLTPLSTKSALILGVVLGLLIISRLDLIFVSAAVLIVFKFRRWFSFSNWSWAEIKSITQEMLLIMGPLVFIVGFILSLNWWYGGAVLPISGALKSSFPQPAITWLDNLWNLKIFWLAILVGGVYLSLQWLVKRRVDYFVLPFWLALGGLFLYNGLFASGIGAWYGAFPLFFTLLILGLSWRDFGQVFIYWLNTHPNLAGVSFILIIILLLGLNLNFVAKQVDWVAPHAVAAQYLETLPAGAAGELKDGVFAFYAGRPVFSLTGLANNLAYVEAIKTNTVTDYFTTHNLKYVVAGSIRSGVQVPGGEEMFLNCHDPIYDRGFVVIFPSANCL